MKKKRLFILFMIFILCMVGCKAKDDNNNNVQERFNVQIAKEIAIEYMERLKANDIEGANYISTPELQASNKIKKLSSMPIMAFQTANINETGNSAYISFYCTRTTGNLSDANLDLVNIKIIKENEKYIISDVKSENISEIYHEKDELRLITKGEGSSQLILRLKDLPLQVYPKGQKPVINKVKVPKDKFSVIGMSYTGSNIAVSTTDGKNSFVGVAIIEEANVESSANVSNQKLVQGQGGSGNQLDEGTLKKILEKPIAQQISGYDVLEDSKIKTLMFNEEEGVLIVQYTKGNGKSLGMKIYSNPDGDLFPIEFEKLFPMDKYNIEYVKSTKNDLLINVTAANKKNISQEVLGSYKIDLVQKSIEKM